MTASTTTITDVDVVRGVFGAFASGRHVAMNMHHYGKFRDGKVRYVRSSEDTAQVAAAMTP